MGTCFLIVLYSKHGWGLVLQKNGVSRPPMSLSLEASWVLSNRSGNSCLHIIFKLSLAATIYWLWRERNCRVFQGKMSEAVDLFGRIEDEIRACLCSWRN